MLCKSDYLRSLTKLSKDCSKECQVSSWPEHKKACKQRAAELHDEELFKEPPLKEECPICFVPLESDAGRSNFQLCCGKEICNGCLHAMEREGLQHWKAGGSLEDAMDKTNCPYCRAQCHDTDAEGMERLNKLLEKDPNNAHAIHFLAFQYQNGAMGLEQNTAMANELWNKAAKFGFPDSLNSVANSYNLGRGITRSTKTALKYYELAAMKGHIQARYNLGVFEAEKQNWERAARHWVMACNGGFTPAYEKITEAYLLRVIGADTVADATRGFKRYDDEVLTDQRKKAAHANGMSIF